MSVWHLDEDLLAAYGQGRPIGPALSASAEAHLEHCQACRDRLVPATDDLRLDAVWSEVVEALDAPRLAPVERLLLRMGTSPDTARLIAITPSLQLSWLTGIALLLGLALLAAHTGDAGVALFLALAPVLPVAGVAVAFSHRTDPLHEVALAAPFSSYRLLLVRAAAVLASTLVLAVPAALLLPSTPWVAAAWLLPALALTCASLAMATRVDPVVSSASLALTWLVLALPVTARGGDPLAVASTVPQLLCLVLLVVACGVLLARRSVSGSPA